MYVYTTRNELIERLVADGHEVVVASQIHLLRNELEALGCRLVDVETDRHGTNPFSDLGLLMRFRSILKDEKPDVVLTFNIKPDTYGGIACRLTKTRYISNITGLGMALAYPGFMQKIAINLYKTGLAGVDCVFFQNEENRQFFIDRRILKENVRTKLIPGSGVSLKQHQAVPYPDETNGIHFLFIARIMQEKGIDLYLDAAKRIHEKHENTFFHICGRCDDKKYVGLLKNASQTGYISYHEEQEDMNPFFDMAHCIVHPSYYPEGMSNVLLEAAAHCRPVITTDQPGCIETVDDGKSGFVIPVKNEEALVEALEKFIAMSWEQKRAMGLAGRAKMEKEFDRQIVVNAYVEEIERISNLSGN